MTYDIPISWSLSAGMAWGAAMAGTPVNAQIAAALIVQAIWLIYRCF